MKKIFFLFSFLCFISIYAGAEGRKTVAVVLSGGGAKGVAHVPVLKAIEKAGIPVDIIVGTSMGSIMGGLYANGYNAEQLDSIVRSLNWTNLLMDMTDRNQLSYTLRQKKERYVLCADFARSPFEVVKGGILKGNNIAMLLSTLTADRLDSISYDKLPIRFACVATDLITGKEVDIRSGILVESMRASMAIPGAFAPVKKDGKVLVDGGLCNNYPADLARRMGADIVIGVNVGNVDTLTAGDVNTPMDVLSVMIDNACSNKTVENQRITDLFIQVNVTGYSAASFSQSAIDTLLVRGEQAASDHWDELVALREKIGLTGAVHAIDRPAKYLSNTGQVTPPATIYNGRGRNSYIGLGVRFDTEELVSMLVGGSYQLSPKSDARVNLDVRLGKRSFGDLSFSVRAFEKWTAKADYRLLFNNLDIYGNGSSVCDVKYTEHLANIHLSRSWRMMKLSAGGEFTYRIFTKVNTEYNYAYITTKLDKEHNIKYYAQLEYDNMNSTQYPTKGIRWLVRYNFFTSDGLKYEGGTGLHIVDGYYQMAIPLASYTTLVPYIAARSLSSRNEQFSNMNVIGGIDHYGFYMPQQLSFAGVNYLEAMNNNIAILGTTLRQRLTTNNYVFGIFNVLTQGDYLRKIFSQQYYGCALGYGYRTPAGPIQANFNWSSLTRHLAFYVSFGFNF